MWTRVTVAAILFSLLFWAYFEIDTALEVLHQHAPSPEAIIKVGMIPMRQIDALCHEIIPRMRPPLSKLRHSLLCDHYKQLVPAMFVLASLTGWCASVWLLAFQRGRSIESESWLAFMASLFLAFVVGVICYLILISPFNFFAGGSSHLENAAIFPLLGGLFLRTFFERVRDVLSFIFDRLTGKKRQPPASNDRRDSSVHHSGTDETE